MQSIPRIFSLLLLAGLGARAAPPAPGSASPAWMDDSYLKLEPPVLSAEMRADTSLREQFLAEHARKTASASWQAYFDAHATDSNLLILPGLVASRIDKQVWLWGWGTGMKPTEPVEFFIVNIRSGQGYESLICTSAQPSDVHRALEFIGLKPGWPAEPGKQRLWPKGDRVSFTVRHRPDGKGPPVEEPIESFVKLSSTGLPMPPTNHVFVGSVMELDPANPSRNVYAADAFSPNSLSSTFNVEATVFDLPRQARKEAVYGSILCAEKPFLDKGRAVFVRIAPHPDFPASAMRELQLVVQLIEGGLMYRLNDEAGKPIAEGREISKVMAEAARIRIGARSVHLRLDLAPELNTRQLAELGNFLSPLDTAEGLKIDPPMPGQLYYRSYTPKEEFRDRKARPFQPWELHLSPAAGGTGWTARLVVLEEKWPEGKIEPDLVETSIPIADPSGLKEATTGREFIPSVLFIFASSDLPHGVANRWIEPTRKRFPVVYVFREPLD